MIDQKKNQLQAMIAHDNEYQTLLKQCLDAEPDYLRIRNSLPSEDQLILERYLSVCEEMDHRKLTIALTI